MLPIPFSLRNINFAQNYGSAQIETSGSLSPAFHKQALTWMVRSNCLQSFESIQFVLVISPCNNLLETPKECGFTFTIEAIKSSLLQVSMKITDLLELITFFAIILCMQIFRNDKAQIEEIKVTSLPSGMTLIIASSLE